MSDQFPIDASQSSSEPDDIEAAEPTASQDDAGGEVSAEGAEPKPARNRGEERSAKGFREMRDTIKRMREELAELRGGLKYQQQAPANRTQEPSFRDQVNTRIMAKAARLKNDDPESVNEFIGEISGSIAEMEERNEKRIREMQRAAPRPEAPEAVNLYNKYPWLRGKEDLINSLTRDLGDETGADMSDRQTYWRTMERAIDVYAKSTGKASAAARVPNGSTHGSANGAMGDSGGGSAMPTATPMAIQGAEHFVSMSRDPKIRALRGQKAYSYFYQNSLRHELGGK